MEETVARSGEEIRRMLVNQANKNDSAQLQTKALFQQQKSVVKYQNMYVIEDVLPLSTVESPAFRKLIGGMTSTQVPDQKSFR